MAISATLDHSDTCPLQALLRLCSKESICDGVVFFPNGYSRIGPLHYRPSGWLKSALYSNSTIDLKRLSYNPAAVLYVKYNAALEGTLAPEVRCLCCLAHCDRKKCLFSWWKAECSTCVMSQRSEHLLCLMMCSVVARSG